MLIIAVVSCGKKSMVSEQKTVEPVIVKEVYRSLNECDSDSSSCTYVRLSYPVFTDSANTLLNNFISQEISTIVSGYFGEETSSRSPGEVAEMFIDDYKQFLLDYPDYRIGWYVEASSEVIYDSAGITSLRIDSEAYSGGAHPNANTTFLNLDKTRAKILGLMDIVRDTSKFKTALEKAYRRKKGLKNHERLEDAGYFFDEPNFVTNDNIGITKDSLLVQFNAYEIASYAEGPTTLSLSRASLAGILKIP